jgi:GNAT superfamily N-acetyltransferase
MEFELPSSRHTVRDVLPADEPELIRLFDACEDYFAAATGLPAGPGDVQSLFYSLPDGADVRDKQVLVVEAPSGELVGLVDLVLHYPDPDACAVGLFLLRPDARRHGLGSALAAALLQRAADGGVRRITATVPEGWEPGRAFLAARSFTLSEPEAVPGARANRNTGPREGTVLRAELRLDAA